MVGELTVGIQLHQSYYPSPCKIIQTAIRYMAYVYKSYFCLLQYHTANRMMLCILLQVVFFRFEKLYQIVYSELYINTTGLLHGDKSILNNIDNFDYNE